MYSEIDQNYVRLACPTDMAEPGAARSCDEARAASSGDGARPTMPSKTMAPRNSEELTAKLMGTHVNVQGNVQALNSTAHEEKIWDHAPGSLDVDPSFENKDICNEDFENAYEIVSEFGSDDDTYNYSEEEDNENFGDDGDDMSIP